jgi:hypothetical protein
MSVSRALCVVKMADTIFTGIFNGKQGLISSRNQTL